MEEGIAHKRANVVFTQFYISFEHGAMCYSKLETDVRTNESEQRISFPHQEAFLVLLQ